jgi:hypothetical protein
VWIAKHTGCISVIKESIPINRNYVPDEKTAVPIAEAVLIGQYGQEKVNAQLPLLAEDVKDWLLVSGTIKDEKGRPLPGGGFSVSIIKHTGCIYEIGRMH